MEYKYIKAWGKKLQSFDYYIQSQIALAQKDNAPFNSVYKSNKTWVTLDQCHKDTQIEIEAIAKNL